MTAEVTGRAAADRCPGILRLASAADGHLARIRLPGGALEPAAARALAAAATELGDGRIELTSRANVQLRGLDAASAGELGDRLAEAGLRPSASHELVRNIVAEPLAGIDHPGSLDALVTRLDTALQARPELARLPGRFLFAVDDAPGGCRRGRVAQLSPDVLLTAGHDVNGVSGTDQVELALCFAEEFLAERATQDSPAWRIAELPGGVRRIRDRVRARLGATLAAPMESGNPDIPAGVVNRYDGRTALLALAPLGRLDAAQLRLLAQAGTVRVTPWRSVLIPDLDATFTDAVRTAGLSVEADSPWRLITACAGKPRCHNALADVQRDALNAAHTWPGRRVHWSGCERHCGRSAATEVDVLATADGYRIDEGPE